MPAITVDDLVMSYGTRVAVNHLSLSIEEKEITVILGRNGAGKTSTIETLEGLRRPTSGSISVLGCHPITDHSKLAPKIGVMLQSGGPYPPLNPLRALQLESTYYANPRNIDELIDRLDLRAVIRTPAKRLSGGEHRRLCLALALVGDPQLIFLDEPTAGVDPHGRIAIRDLITELRADGKTIVLSTHELDEAERIADRIVIFHHGQLVASGAIADLTSATDELRFRTTPGTALADLEVVIGNVIVERSPGDYRIASATSPELIAAIATYLSERGLPLQDIGAAGTSLEDLFLAVTPESNANEQAE